MGLWGIVMVAANAAQLAVWGKQALESDKGKATVAEVKKKAGAAGTVAQAGAQVAGTVANEAGKVIVEKTRPVRETIADKLEKLAGRIEKSEADEAADFAAAEEAEKDRGSGDKSTQATVETNQTDSPSNEGMPTPKDSW